jgi:hypothetical protein
MCTVRLIYKVCHRHLLSETKNRIAPSLIQPVLELLEVEKSAFFQKSDYTVVTHC